MEAVWCSLNHCKYDRLDRCTSTVLMWSLWTWNVYVCVSLHVCLHLHWAAGSENYFIDVHSKGRVWFINTVSAELPARFPIYTHWFYSLLHMSLYNEKLKYRNYYLKLSFIVREVSHILCVFKPLGRYWVWHCSWSKCLLLQCETIGFNLYMCIIFIFDFCTLSCYIL